MITYQSIDNLLRTNEALAQFNTTSKQLTQSQKALARTILVLQTSRNAWGDAYKTIDTLENQIRVFQGTLQNLKLTLGDTFAEPVRKALIHINGFLNGVNDVIRVFFNLKKETGNKNTNPFANITESAKEANKEVGLLKFDEFNVLEQGGESELAENQAITSELEHQLDIYTEQYETVQKMYEGMHNEVQQIAESIKNWFVTPEGTLTDQAKGLSKVLLGVFGILNTINLVKLAKNTEKLTGLIGLLQIALHHLPLVAIIGAIEYMYIKNEAFRESVNRLITALLALTDSVLTPLFKLLSPISELVANILYSISNMLTPLINVIAYLVELLDKSGALEAVMWAIIGLFGVIESIHILNTLDDYRIALQKLTKGLTSTKIALGLVVASTVLLISNIANLIHNWDDMSSWQRASGIIAGVASAIMLVVGAIAAFQGSWSMGTAVAAITAGLIAVGASIAAFWDSAKKNAMEVPKFANGGIPSVGSLFVAGEAGAELVGNIGGQTNVINMEQLTQAVQRGALGAILQAYDYMDSGEEQRTISIQIDGKEVFNSVQSVAKAQGLEFSRVK